MNYKCGNCKWFLEPRKGNANCRQLYGVSKETKPCPALHRLHGHFTPIEWGDRTEALESVIGAMTKDDLQMLRVLISYREDEILRSGIHKFRIGMTVEVEVSGERFRGKVIGVTQSHVTVECEDKKRRCFPGELTIV